MTAHVYLVRHGQTLYNLMNKMQGWSDTPLTDAGIAGARQTGQWLRNVHFDGAYSSDLGRAAKTCQLILEENLTTDPAAQVQLPAFREQNYGYFEGMDKQLAWRLTGAQLGMTTLKEIVASKSFDEAKDLMKAADPYHLAEDHTEYWQRVDAGFNQLRADYHRGNILVVTHSNTIASLVDRFSTIDVLADYPKNGGVTRLSLTDDGLTVDYYNRTGADQEY